MEVLEFTKERGLVLFSFLSLELISVVHHLNYVGVLRDTTVTTVYSNREVRPPITLTLSDLSFLRPLILSSRDHRSFVGPFKTIYISGPFVTEYSPTVPTEVSTR